MVKSLRIVVIVVAMLVLLLSAGVAWLVLAFPKVAPAAAMTIDPTPDRLARGRYLFHHVAACAACHSRRDWTLPSGPEAAGTIGMGGEAFGRADGIPGTIYARNITPAALGPWSDGEIYRSLACGVSRDGRALFPLMPYANYAQLAADDLLALVAYTRSLAPLEHAVPERSLAFPMNVIVRTIPRDAVAVAQPPPRSDTVAYGRYLATAAACIHCHSPAHHGRPVAGREYSGGVEFSVAGVAGTVRSANITPDQGTGIGSWTREAFVARFTGGVGTAASASSALAGFNTPMPWSDYAGMTVEDLGAIYDFLRTLPAVDHAVMVYSPR